MAGALKQLVQLIRSVSYYTGDWAQVDRDSFCVTCLHSSGSSSMR